MGLRICFVALHAYPILVDMAEARTGGAEVQQLLIGKYLAQRGHDVSFITRDHGQPEGMRVDGITLYKTFRQEAGLPYLRFFHPRLTGIWQALRRADADVYYQRCAGMITGVLAMHCRLAGRKFVFASGSDSDFDPRQIIVTNARDRWLYLRGLPRAAAVVAQTERQRSLLRKNFGQDAEVIPNCWDEPDPGPESPLAPGYVLWAGTMRAWKRPQTIVEMAEQLPHVRFVMLGGPAMGEEGVHEEVRRRAAALPNVRFEGFVPFRQVGRYFNGAAVVVNTSEPKEGFPNTFLQAWRRGIPVVSYFDPDDIVRRYGLGHAVRDREQMQEALQKLLTDGNHYAQLQRNISEYFVVNHHIESIGPRYERLFEQLARAG